MKTVSAAGFYQQLILSFLTQRGFYTAGMVIDDAVAQTNSRATIARAANRGLRDRYKLALNVLVWKSPETGSGTVSTELMRVFL